MRGLEIGSVWIGPFLGGEYQVISRPKGVRSSLSVGLLTPAGGFEGWSVEGLERSGYRLKKAAK